MMNRKIKIILVLMLSLAMLSGCSLAKEGALKSQDRLVGALITLESLDIKVMEAEPNPEFMAALESGDFQLDGKLKTHEGKIYATPSTEIKNYIFEGIEGFAMYSPTMHMEDENESYTSMFADDAINDGDFQVHVGDKEKIIVEGTLYYSSSIEIKPLYMNPVYQTEKGLVYTVPGQGVSFSVEGSLESSGSQTLEETLTINDNGVEKSSSAFVKINYKSMFTPEKITVVEMSEHNKQLIRREYKPGTLPEKMEIPVEAGYLIIETLKNDAEGNAIVTRDIIDREDDRFYTYMEREDGILLKSETLVEWR